MLRRWRNLGLAFLIVLLGGQGAAGGEMVAVLEDELALFELMIDREQMVEVVSRSPRLLSQVAENVTVITAAEIAAMHAHSLAEVLQGQPGIFVSRLGSEFNGSNVILTQGSQREHTLVLLDGVRRNSVISGDDDLKGIPLAIIERVEIIRGPASSAWGSSLGGVINIVTKETGSTTRPVGNLAATHGERGVADYNLDLAGRTGSLGYFLYAGRQDSDGLLADRYYRDDRFYGKLRLELPRRSILTLSGGHSDPRLKWGDFVFGSAEHPDVAAEMVDGTSFVNLGYETLIAERLTLNLALRYFERNFVNRQTILPGSPAGVAGELHYVADWREESSAVALTGDYLLDRHRLSFGGEFQQGEMGSVTRYGSWTQTNWAVPAVYRSRPGREEKWGVYLNGAFNHGRLTITPGLRYDHHSISESFVSPSLGMVYRLSEQTLLRATVARGFTQPTLLLTVAGGIWNNPNPNLGPESATSWQGGIESAALPWVAVKTTIFQHEIRNAWQFDAINTHYVNGGKNRRRGVELEFKTESWHRLSLAANLTWVHEKSAAGSDATTGGNLTLTYDDHTAWRASLSGHYIRWGDGSFAHPDARDDNYIWSLSLTRTVALRHGSKIEIHAKVRNLFNGSQYATSYYPDPGRWLEAGLSLRF